MACERWQEAISARADGEDTGVDVRLLDAHVGRCAACAAFAATIAASRGAARLQAAPSVPDLAGRVARLSAIADRAGSWGVVRGLLAVVAVQIIAFSFPALVLGDEQDTAAHAARHLGAFTVAYAVGLLVVVARPARARTMLPVAAVVSGALLIGAVVDLVRGRVPIVGEMLHLPEVISVVLVWLIASPGPRRATPAVTRTAPLQVVDSAGGRRDRRAG